MSTTTTPPASLTALSIDDDDIGARITRLESEISAWSNNRALYMLVGLFMLAGITITFFGKALFDGSQWKSVGDNSRLVGVAFTFYSAFGGIYWYFLRTSRVNSKRAELAALQKKLHFMAPVGNGETSYFDRLVNINVTNLEAYYGLVKVHTNNSFIVAISAGGVGFVLVLTGLVIGFTSLHNAETIAYISTASGIVTEFISGVFFYLYNRTVRQLKEYHDSLLAVQNILLSFKIVNDTTNEGRKSDMMERMINRLVGADPRRLPGKPPKKAAKEA